MRKLFTTGFALVLFLAILYAAGGETCMESIRKRLIHHDHVWMTFAAVNVLSNEEKEFLEPELELLITTYSGFPDINWSLYGEWGGWSGYPENGRAPDRRREWNVSHYMDCDPVAETGIRYMHSSPDVYTAGRKYFRKAVEYFRNGKHRDGVIMMGIISHYLEDEATFAHMQALHRGHEFDFSRIDIKGYEPKILGRDINSSLIALEKRARAITAFVNERSLAVRQAIKDGDDGEFRRIHLECKNEGAKAAADMMRTAIYLAGKRPAAKFDEYGINLIKNSSFEEDDGSGIPERWYIGWCDLKDPAGRPAWEKKLSRNTRNSHTGKGSVSIMWAPEKGIEWKQRWPEAICVSPGEKYYLTGWLKTHNATGNSCITLECYERNNKFVRRFKSVSRDGTNDWQKIGLEIIIPEGAEKAVVTCRSEKNQGMTWFDDIELVMVAPGEPARAQGVIGRDDLALYLPFEEKGYRIEDESTYRDMNNPIITCSGKEVADLHILMGKGLKFNGVNDFLELPFSRIQDPLASFQEITISLRVCCDKLQNACLLSKEPPDRGYRIELSEDGKIKFLLSSGPEGKTVAETSTDYPVKKWFHAACTAKAGEQVKIYVNGVLQAQSDGTVTGINAAEADFYLGASRGTGEFFKGRIDELKIYNRILDISEINILMKQKKSP